jgi:hypothetical protein
LSEYGVPDDDMSDSLPPDGGPDPDDGWDLEGLLSGANVWLPEGMRPVAGTLAALRAAPVRAELAGEAAARAAFREVMLARGHQVARADGAAVNARTLIRPTRTADGGPHAATRPRHAHRRPPRRGHWRSKTLAVGAVGAAVVVITGGIALAGVFSGAGGHSGGTRHDTAVTSTTAKSGATGPGPGGLEGSAAKESTASPAPSASGGQQSSPGSGAESQRSELCHQYWAFFSHPESSAEWRAAEGTLHRLSELAGSPWDVPRYCGAYPQWGFAPPPQGADPGSDPAAPAPRVGGDSPRENQPDSHAGSGNGGAGNPDGGNGDGNNGNGPARHGPGSGDQSRH